MTDSRWKFVSASMGAFAILFFVLTNIALNQRDEARRVTRDQAIEQLCKGAVSTKPQPLAEPAAGQPLRPHVERFQL